MKKEKEKNNSQDKNFIQQKIEKSIELVEKYGLSKMTMKEISKEVNAVRKKTTKNS